MNDKDTICLSTEELIAEFNTINDMETDSNIIVGSLDVKALYPSLDIDFSIEKVCEIFQKSEITLKGIDFDEVGL